MTKNIVISGIANGIGAAITRKFAQDTQENYTIYGFSKNGDFSGIHNPICRIRENIYGFTEKLYLPAEWGFNEQTIIYLEKLDAQYPEQIKSFIYKVNGLRNTKIDILINNVGIYKTGSLFAEPDEQWQELLSINLNAAYYLTKYLYKNFDKNTHIFNICSVASKEIVKDAPSYSISKMALYGLHKAMIQELEPMGIKVTAILPGAVYTNSWKDAPNAIKNVILPAEDIAQLIWDMYHLAPQSVVKEVEIKPLNF